MADINDPPTDTLGVWCRGTLPNGQPCRSVEVIVVETSRRLEGILRMRKCTRCGARLVTTETLMGATDKRKLRSGYPAEMETDLGKSRRMKG